MTIPSRNNKKSADHVSNLSNSLSFESWMSILEKKTLSIQDHALFLKGLHDHPDWINQTGSYHQTPLISAALYGHVEVAKTLIEAGADIYRQDQEFWTALVWASFNGHQEIVQALIQAGADLDLKNQGGGTALMEASRRGLTAVVNTLIQGGADIHFQDRTGWTALMMASLFGQHDVVKTLIQEGSNLHLQDEKGWTVLMIAVDQNYFEIVQTFIQQGVDPLLMNHDHETALDLARKKSDTTIFLYLEAYVASQALNQVIQSQESSSPHSLNEVQSQAFLKTPRL